MKYIATLLAAAALSATTSHAVTLSGTAARFIGDKDGVTIATTNTLAFLIVDTDGDGFGVLSQTINPFSFTAGTAAGVTNVIGGDRIIRAFGSGGNATTPVLNNILPSTNLATAGDLLGKNFAVLWFPGLTSSATELGGNQTFGFVRSSNWTLPAADSGLLTFGATPNTVGMNQDGDAANYDAPVANPSLPGAFYTFVDTNGPLTAGGIRGAATLTIVPEPSTAALGLLAGLGLVARRRRA